MVPRSYRLPPHTAAEALSGGWFGRRGGRFGRPVFDSGFLVADSDFLVADSWWPIRACLVADSGLFGGRFGPVWWPIRAAPDPCNNAGVWGSLGWEVSGVGLEMA